MEVFSKLCQTTVSVGGSCFRSYLNRFLSADTIVPDPTNPQSFNRYSYVLNSPVNFNDPTGHCAERGSSQEADACWDYLENEFCVGIDCGEEGWQHWLADHILFGLRELWLINDSLKAIKGALQNAGISDWQSTLPNSFKIESGIGSDYGASYNSSTERVTLFQSLLDEDDVNVAFGIIHEIGHAIDHKATGADYFNSNSPSLMAGITILELGTNGFIPGANCMRIYACSSPREGWADAFTMYVINTQGAAGANWVMDVLINDSIVLSEGRGLFGIPTRYYLSWNDIGNVSDATANALTTAFGP